MKLETKIKLNSKKQPSFKKLNYTSKTKNIDMPASTHNSADQQMEKLTNVDTAGNINISSAGMLLNINTIETRDESKLCLDEMRVDGVLVKNDYIESTFENNMSLPLKKVDNNNIKLDKAIPEIVVSDAQNKREDKNNIEDDLVCYKTVSNNLAEVSMEIKEQSTVDVIIDAVARGDFEWTWELNKDLSDQETVMQYGSVDKEKPDIWVTISEEKQNSVLELFSDSLQAKNSVSFSSHDSVHNDSSINAILDAVALGEYTVNPFAYLYNVQNEENYVPFIKDSSKCDKKENKSAKTNVLSKKNSEKTLVDHINDKTKKNSSQQKLKTKKLHTITKNDIAITHQNSSNKSHENYTLTPSSETCNDSKEIVLNADSSQNCTNNKVVMSKINHSTSNTDSIVTTNETILSDTDKVNESKKIVSAFGKRIGKKVFISPAMRNQITENSCKENALILVNNCDTNRERVLSADIQNEELFNEKSEFNSEVTDVDKTVKQATTENQNSVGETIKPKYPINFISAAKVTVHKVNNDINVMQPSKLSAKYLQDQTAQDQTMFNESFNSMSNNSDDLLLHLDNETCNEPSLFGKSKIAKQPLSDIVELDENILVNPLLDPDESAVILNKDFFDWN